MDEKTLILEGLPDDLDLVRSKLELYFKNKRKSGGEVQQIREHPEDKRKALLIYTDEADIKKILEKGTHQIDFKAQGVTDLTVKLLEIKKEKPALFPKQKTKPFDPGSLAQPTVIQEPASKIQEIEEISNTKDLLICTMESVDKEMLTIYFEQFTEQAEITKHGKNSWILKVSKPSDVLKILAEKDHDFGLTVEVYKEANGAEEWDPRRFILTGFKDSCTCKFITMFIGSCSEKAEHTWEILEDERIVVTFKEDVEAESFLKKCTTKKLKDMKIEASHLEITDSVLVQGDMSKIREEYLNLYFSSKKRSGGGDIKSLIWVTENKSLVISFEDSHDAQEVVKRSHTLCGTDLSIMLFYTSLGKALTGQMTTQSDIKTKVTIPVDENVWNFIERREKYLRDLQLQLKKVHTNITYDNTTSPGEIVLEMAMDKETLAAVRLGTTWKDKAKIEAQTFLSRFSKAELAAEVEAWKRVKHDCFGLVTADVDLTYVDTKCKISVVGLKNWCNSSLLHKIKHLLKDAAAELEVERNTVDKVIQFDSKEMFELVTKAVHTRLNNVAFIKYETTLSFHLNGLRDNVHAAEMVIQQAQANVDFRHLRLSACQINFLKTLDLKTFEQNHFVTCRIPAFFLNDGKCFGILAEKEHIEKAEDKVKKVLKEEIIQLTHDVTVINSEKWMNFLSTLKAEMQLRYNGQDAHIIPSEEEVVVCGFAQAVAYLSQKIKDYLKNMLVTEEVHLGSLREVEFVDTCMKLSEISEIRDHGVTILSCRTQNSPCLKVTAPKENIQDAVNVVKKHLSTIKVEKQTYSKAGESKVIHKHEANIKAKAVEFGCKAFISKICTHQINSDITLTVTTGDLLAFAVDAFVCPMNSQLTFDNPVAQMFLQAGGSQIQAVCNKFQKEKQFLFAGDVVCSDSGNLNAKTLLYAVVPPKGHNLGSQYLESAILNSLQKAEARNSVSIAMPAIGSGTFGFSVKESCMAIREAVLKFSNDQDSPKNIKNIFVVDYSDKVVEQFSNLISELGFSYVKPSAHAANSTPQEPAKYFKQGSAAEVTIHGVQISLKNGDITKETVDVIVNSNNSSLDLDTGVSGAILKGAGKSVMNECQKHGPQKPDGVVFTSGGDLSCKHIAHIVGPSCAADISVSIEKALNLCEGMMAATVAIPSIGTGRGGIGARDSIEAILTGVEKYLSQSVSSCLKTICVVVFDKKIMETYCSCLKERNNEICLKPVCPAQCTMPANQVKIGAVRIEIKKGNITNETVRGIVNTTNNQMNLTKGVSGAIFKAAGPSVEQECQKHGPLQSDTVAVTSAGNLQCDFIIHMMGPHSTAEATLRVKKVLERCEDKNISTVSFPAVGTGGGGLKGIESITAMLQAFEEYLTERASTAIKLIYVVIEQDELLKEFLQGLKQWTSDTKQEESCNISNEDSLQSEEEHDSDVCIGPVKVTVLCGNIINETTEAIVSSTNTSLNLSTGVSGAILKAAGKTVEEECKALGVQPSDGVVLTKAGNLQFKKIVHMVGQTKEKEITNSMYKVLKMCEENKIKSVSFPALGTGAGNLAASRVANAMMDALTYFCIDSPKFLKNVHIVIFQSQLLPDFKDALTKFRKSPSNPTIVTVPDPIMQTSNPIKPTLCLAAETAVVTFPVTNVQIYGASSVDINKAKKYIDDLIYEECISEDVTSSHLANLPEADKKAIVALCLSNQVHVLVAAKDKLTVTGKKDDVLDVVRRIEKILLEAQEREKQEEDKMRLSKTLCWQVAEGEAWRSLDSSISYHLELAFHKKQQTFTYQYNGVTYTVDLNKMEQVNGKGQVCTVKRTLFGDSDTAIIQCPPTWTKMDGKDLEIVVLHKDTEEYKKIEREFIRSSKHRDVAPVEVVEIRRIQSQGQWQRYCVLKQAVDKKYPSKKNEKFLYHGTTKDICEKINKNGFNRSFCGRNAVVHGDGTYFAKEAWYSCQDQYSNPDVHGLKYIYRARVVTGSPCKSRQGMKEPDPLDPNDPQAGLYDCAVDNLQNPFIFVVFCDAGAYPDYLITFKNI